RVYSFMQSCIFRNLTISGAGLAMSRFLRSQKLVPCTPNSLTGRYSNIKYLLICLKGKWTVLIQNIQ
ncbi:MAG: hypothetical protein QNL11_00175, partial [Desulfobacterales bacterium]|nr:hypothetical protein [Desulfobacterales bacterium]